MLNQSIDGIVGLRAVVACDDNINIGRNDGALHSLNTGDRLVGHNNSVGIFAFGNGKRNTWMLDNAAGSRFILR